MTTHLKDEQLQDFASGTPLDPKARNHFQNCDFCQAKVKEYKTLFQHLKTEPAIQLSSAFLNNLMQQLPNKKAKFSLDIIWIISGGLFSFGMLIYFTGIKPFQNIFQSLNGSFEESAPVIWEPLSQFIDKSPISGSQFLMGGTAIIFILIADFLCRQIFTNHIKKG